MFRSIYMFNIKQHIYLTLYELKHAKKKEFLNSANAKILYQKFKNKRTKK